MRTTPPFCRKSATVRPTPTRTDEIPKLTGRATEEKARKEMADKAKGKGPLNTGTQGIKKSGKK